MVFAAHAVPAPSPAVMSSPQTSRKGIRHERISGTHGVDNRHRFRSLTQNCAPSQAMLPFSPSVTITVLRHGQQSLSSSDAAFRLLAGGGKGKIEMRHQCLPERAVPLSEKSKAVSLPAACSCGNASPHVPRLPRAQCHTAPARRNLFTQGKVGHRAFGVVAKNAILSCSST